MFREWSIAQRWLLPPSVQELVPANYVAHFIREVVREELNLTEIFAAYDEERGAPPFHPTMITALLLYAYSQGVYSSRRIARGCEERLDFMAVTAMQRPDFRTVSEFRRRHLRALEGLFKQVLRLCQRAGMARKSALAREMTARVKRGGHRSRYRLRKQIVEPVNGHIKEARGFRRFSMRGAVKARGEWSLLCSVHNLLKVASIDR